MKTENEETSFSRLSGGWYRGEGQTHQSRIRAEAGLHEQGAAKASVGTEGARPPAEEPVTVREAAAETSDGCN